MTAVEAPVFGLVGALEALPRRLAVRAVEATGGRLHRRSTRKTRAVVFGRTLLGRLDAAAIEAQVDAEAGHGRALLSETGFLRRLGLLPPAQGQGLAADALRAQSGLAPRDLELLALFDAFEHDAEPFSFRDLILARKYAGLIAGGASWAAIARSVHRTGPVVSLTAMSLQLGGDRAIYARDAAGLSELDGQMLLSLEAADDDPDDAFAAAEAAEAAGQHDAAAALYARCLGLDPGDAIAAFNRANCLRAAGREAEAEADYSRALLRDPDFVEAWFNLAGLLGARGRHAAARRCLERATALDPDYADAAFNLATLAFETGDLDTARRNWERYLELDPGSEWAQAAARGLRYIRLHTAARGTG